MVTVIPLFSSTSLQPNSIPASPARGVCANPLPRKLDPAAESVFHHQARKILIEVSLELVQVLDRGLGALV